MPKWKRLRLQQELVDEVEREVEKRHYPSLSDFVSEAIRLRLDELKQSHEPVERNIENRNDCLWCVGMKKLAVVVGLLTRRSTIRTKDLFTVRDCEWSNTCSQVDTSDCLVGTSREGDWRTY